MQISALGRFLWELGGFVLFMIPQGLVVVHFFVFFHVIVMRSFQQFIT